MFDTIIFSPQGRGAYILYYNILTPKKEVKIRCHNTFTPKISCYNIITPRGRNVIVGVNLS